MNFFENADHASSPELMLLADNYRKYMAFDDQGDTSWKFMWGLVNMPGYEHISIYLVDTENIDIQSRYHSVFDTDPAIRYISPQRTTLVKDKPEPEVAEGRAIILTSTDNLLGEDCEDTTPRSDLLVQTSLPVSETRISPGYQSSTQGMPVSSTGSTSLSTESAPPRPRLRPALGDLPVKRIDSIISPDMERGNNREQDDNEVYEGDDSDVEGSDDDDYRKDDEDSGSESDDDEWGSGMDDEEFEQKNRRHSNLVKMIEMLNRRGLHPRDLLPPSVTDPLGLERPVLNNVPRIETDKENIKDIQPLLRQQSRLPGKRKAPDNLKKSQPVAKKSRPMSMRF